MTLDSSSFVCLFSDLALYKIFFNVYLFFRERERKQRRGKETGRERIPSRLQAVGTEPDPGLELTNYEVMT